MKKFLTIASFVAAFFLVRDRMSMHAWAETKAAPQIRINDNYGKLPMMFEPNRGQAAGWGRFVSRGRGYRILLDAAESEFRFPGTKAGSHNDRLDFPDPDERAKPVPEETLKLKIVGADPGAIPVACDELITKSNYLIGNDRSKWHRNMPTYSKVKVHNLYPGIDIVYYGNGSQLECDWIVAPWSDPRQIQFKFENAGQRTLDSAGNLTFGSSSLQLRRPLIYQEKNGLHKEIYGEYALLDNGKIGFKLGGYDRSLPLTIDPVINYCRYLGTAGDDLGFGVAVDSLGNAYVTGTTDLTGQDANVFVAKLDPSGSTLLYNTTFGGTYGDQPRAIAVDSSGNAYITGYTMSSNFPTKNAIQGALKGSQDAFIIKLNAAGDDMLFSTYFGGSGSEAGYALALDSSANIYVSGNTASSNFPTTSGVFQPAYGGGADSLILKMNSSGSSVVYASYLGGSGNENGRSLAVDASGSVYVTGRTSSSDFPTVAPFQSNLAGGNDAYVTKISPAGDSIVFSTYIGGSSGDVGHGITVDSSGNVYVVGKTSSADFPVVNALQPSYHGGAFDGWFAKFNPSGNALAFSSFFGGNGDEEFLDIVLDSSGNIYITGYTASTDMTTVQPIQASLAGVNDVFVAEITPSGNTLVYSTYIGGSYDDEPYRMAVDSSNGIYIVGWTASTDMPMGASFQSIYSGGPYDAFILKLDQTSSSVKKPKGQLISD
jgi:hypothetical protein